MNLSFELHESGLVLLEMLDPLAELVDCHLLLQRLSPHHVQLLLQLFLLTLLLEDDLVQALLVLAAASENKLQLKTEMKQILFVMKIVILFYYQ